MLHISKKKSENQPINIEICNAFSSDALAVEMDEMWSYYHDKKHQSWLWWAVDHDTGTPLAFTFGPRTDDMLYELIALLEKFNIAQYIQIIIFPIAE